MAEDNNFPAGMHVLAVNNEPIALQILESMLQKCHYNDFVWPQAQAYERILQLNFRHEDEEYGWIQTPRICRSQNELACHNDPELIMKGIECGVCDFLAKLVRFEEIKKIWQHVYRRWLKSIRPGPSTAEDNVDFGVAENGGQESRQETEESRKQERPRLAWSTYLHGKFIAAVNQLRGDLVTPKRGFELMDVEGITKEHVAIHLQKYRQYLRRMDEAKAQQGDVASQYGRNNPYDGLANLGALATTWRYPSPYISPTYQQGGIFGSSSNAIRIDRENTALSQAIQPYSNNPMFQPIGLQTFQNSSQTFDLTQYTFPRWISSKRREEDERSS